MKNILLEIGNKLSEQIINHNPNDLFFRSSISEQRYHFEGRAFIQTIHDDITNKDFIQNLIWDYATITLYDENGFFESFHDIDVDELNNYIL